MEDASVTVQDIFTFDKYGSVGVVRFRGVSPRPLSRPAISTSPARCRVNKLYEPVCTPVRATARQQAGSMRAEVIRYRNPRRELQRACEVGCVRASGSRGAATGRSAAL